MDSWTVFDLVAAGVVILSAIMSLGRGLIREAFSVVAFAVGFIVALLTVMIFLEPVKKLFNTQDSLVPATILVAVGFLLAYMAAAFLGGRLAKLIHTSPEIGVLDRLAGAGFGVARGFLAMLLLVLLVKQLLPDGEPDWMYKSWSYKTLLGPSADVVGNAIIQFIDYVIKTLHLGAGFEAPKVVTP